MAIADGQVLTAADFLPYANVGVRGGMLFALPSVPHPGAQGIVPITGFGAVPLESWGDTSWRGVVDASALRIATAGAYQIIATVAFERSGDSEAAQIVCTRRLAANSWVRPEVLFLANPTNRALPRIASDTGLLGSISYTLTGAVTTTSASATISVERVGD